MKITEEEINEYGEKAKEIQYIANGAPQGESRHVNYNIKDITGRNFLELVKLQISPGQVARLEHCPKHQKVKGSIPG